MAFGDFNTFKPRGYKEPLADPEADSVIKRLGSVSSSALQSGLYALDTPGAIVRGGLGKLAGVKASDGDRVSGRDLLNHIGVTDKYDKGWGSWGLGLGAEILTDPLSYISPLSLTRGGLAAAKTGATKGLSRVQMLRGFNGTEDALRAAGHGDDAISRLRTQGQAIATPDAERAIMASDPEHFVSRIGQPGSAPSVTNRPLQALAGVGLPFASPSAFIGTGRTAQGIAGGIDSVAGRLKYGTTAGRWLNGMFDNRTHESVGGEIQRAMVEAGHPAYEAAQREGRGYLEDVKGLLDPAIRAGVPEDHLLDAVTDAVETVRPSVAGPSPHPSARAAGDLIRQSESAQRLRENAWGGPLQDAGDQYVHYGPRQGLDIQSARDIASGQIPTTRSLTNPQMTTVNNLPVASGENFHRNPAYTNVPGGSNQLNSFARQYAGSALQPRAIERDIQRQMIGAATANGITLDRPAIRALRAKAEELTPVLQRLPADHAAHDIGIYSNNAAANVARSAESFAQKSRTQAAVHRVIGNEARLASTLGTDAVPISQVLDDVGLSFNRNGDAQSFLPANGSYVRSYQELARQGMAPLGPLQHGTVGQLRGAIDQYALPRRIYNDLIQSHGRWSTPETLSGPLQAARDATTTFKNLVYPLFPASVVRNFGGGTINNVATGTSGRAHAAALGILRDTATTDELRRFFPDMPAGTSDEAARALARRNGFVDAKIGNGHAGSIDLENNLAAQIQGQTPGRITPELAMANRTGGGNMAQDTGRLIGGALNDQFRSALGVFQNPFGGGGLRSPVRNPFRGEGPLAMEGVWGHGNTDFPALRAGRMVGQNTEDFLRMAKYLGEREKGFTGEMAGDATRNLHFDYDHLTKFEKNVMRQAFPFYTFMRKNLPLQAGYLAHNPVYPMTQMRTMEGMRDQSGYTPAYLSGGAAVPIPGGAGGNQRYISGFGTPLEEALERVKFRNGLPDPVGTAQAYLASGNPFIKAPLEQIFDKQLSTGRKLSDLRAQGVAKQIGGIWGDDNPQLLAQVLANSPAARFASSFDKLTDDRKPIWARALNLGTGVKLTDVNTERQKAIEAAAVRNQLLSSMPHIAQYTHYYPRKGEEENLTPEEIEMLRLIPTMRNRAIEANQAQQRIGIQSR